MDSADIEGQRHAGSELLSAEGSRASARNATGFIDKAPYESQLQLEIYYRVPLLFFP
jgi:hypothetical protein